MRKTPYHTAADSIANSRRLLTCSARNHHQAKRTTLCRPKKISTPTSTRQPVVTGAERRRTHGSSSVLTSHDCQMKRRGAIENRRVPLARQRGAERQRDVGRGAPGMEAAVDAVVRPSAVEVQVHLADRRGGDEARFGQALRRPVRIVRGAVEAALVSVAVRRGRAERELAYRHEVPGLERAAAVVVEVAHGVQRYLRRVVLPRQRRRGLARMLTQRGEG